MHVCYWDSLGNLCEELYNVDRVVMVQQRSDRGRLLLVLGLEFNGLDGTEKVKGMLESRC